MRLGRSISAVAGTSAIALAGLFLGLSPWLAGWHHGGSWSLATKTDFWSGLGLVVISLMTMMLYRARLTRELVSAGIISRKPKLEETLAQADSAVVKEVPDISDEALLSLANSVVRNISDSYGQGVDGAKALALPKDSPVSEEELARLAAALLREIQESVPKGKEADAPSGTPESPLALMSEAELAQMAASLLQEIQATETRPLVHSGEEMQHE